MNEYTVIPAGLGGWGVLHPNEERFVAVYTLRTNWIDGREGDPLGPLAAAEEVCRRLNEDGPEAWAEHCKQIREKEQAKFKKAMAGVVEAERGDPPPPPNGGYGVWQLLD